LLEETWRRSPISLASRGRSSARLGAREDPRPTDLTFSITNTRATIALFQVVTGVNDPTKIAAEHIRAFKKHLLDSRAASKTIGNHRYLSMVLEIRDGQQGGRRPQPDQGRL
jgi:hypothetical protein